MAKEDDYVSVKIPKKLVRMFLTCIDRLALLYPCEGNDKIKKCPFIRKCDLLMESRGPWKFEVIEANFPGTPCQIIYNILKERLKHEKS